MDGIDEKSLGKMAPVHRADRTRHAMGSYDARADAYVCVRCGYRLARYVAYINKPGQPSDDDIVPTDAEVYCSEQP